VDVRESMLIQSPLPTKRSKRRENSVDEDSNARAERLKAERNIDSPGKATPKSFLALTDAQIATRITTLGVSLGSNLDKYSEYKNNRAE
jgi:ribosomal protein L9